MTPEQELKRDLLKEWYSANGKSMIEFIQDVRLTQELNGCATVGSAIDHMYAEHEALGNLKPK